MMLNTFCKHIKKRVDFNVVKNIADMILFTQNLLQQLLFHTNVGLTCLAVLFISFFSPPKFVLNSNVTLGNKKLSSSFLFQL